METRTMPRAPLAVSVGNTSQLVLAGTTEYYLGLKGTIVAWEAGVVTLYGAIVRNAAGLLYVCVGAGTTGSTEPVHTTGTVSDGAATWRRIHGGRQTLTLKNTASAGSISISRGVAAVAGSGIVLNALESHREGYSSEIAPYDGPWYAVSDSTRSLAISEG